MKTIDQQILEEIDGKYQEIERLKQLLAIVEKLGMSKTEDCVLYNCGVDWNDPTREKFAEIRKFFPAGTKWDKSLNGANHAKIDYQTDYEGFRFRLWNAPPPPSCRVEYEEKFIQAHTERVPKLVCNGGSDE